LHGFVGPLNANVGWQSWHGRAACWVPRVTGAGCLMALAGTNAVVVWHGPQSVWLPCCTPWQSVQFVPRAFAKGVPWHRAHVSLPCAPVSGKKSVWLHVDETAPFALWHDEHDDTPWTGPWQPMHVDPLTLANAMFGWHLVHASRACGPPARGRYRLWVNLLDNRPLDVWHAPHLVSPPCWAPWHPRHVRPFTSAYRFRGWHLVQASRAWGPPDSWK
jgi:hypothetical protein